MLLDLYFYMVDGYVMRCYKLNPAAFCKIFKMAFGNIFFVRISRLCAERKSGT